MTDLASGERVIDYSALTDPVSKAEVEDFSERMADEPDYRWSFAGWVASMVLLSLATLFFALCVGVFVALVVTGGWVESKPSTLFGAFFGILVCSAIGFAPGFFLFRTIRKGARWQAWYRMSGFAAENYLVFSVRDRSPQFPGSVFHPAEGYRAELVEHFDGPAGRFSYGNMFARSKDGKNSTEETGYLAVRLERRLPHMVLKSRRSRPGVGGLSNDFVRDQTLSLEGDFDRHFTLYCPREYETDALYVFTPDLMALLIDEASRFDLEIVDDWMLAYPSGYLDLRRPRVNRAMLRIADLVGSKALGRSRYYRDDRVGDFGRNVVAKRGRRLRRRVGIVSGVVLLVLVLSSPFWGLIAEAVLDR